MKNNIDPSSPEEQDKVSTSSPYDSENEGNTTNISNVAAFVSKSIEEPDKFLTNVEGYYPGFLKRVLDAIETENILFRRRRFFYGGLKAYLSLALSLLGGLVSLAMFVWLIVTDSTNFHHIILLISVYAITQSGVSGINKIVASITKLLIRSKEQRPVFL